MVNLTWFPDGKRLLAPIFHESSYLWDPDMWIISPTNDPTPTLLERHGLQASISPDGRFIVFLGQDGDDGGLYITDSTGGSWRWLRRKHDQELIFSPVWSPDDQWIAYTYTWMEDGKFRARIVVQPASGGRDKILLSP